MEEVWRKQSLQKYGSAKGANKRGALREHLAKGEPSSLKPPPLPESKSMKNASGIQIHWTEETITLLRQREASLPPRNTHTQNQMTPFSPIACRYNGLHPFMGILSFSKQIIFLYSCFSFGPDAQCPLVQWQERPHLKYSPNTAKKKYRVIYCYPWDAAQNNDPYQTFKKKGNIYHCRRMN